MLRRRLLLVVAFAGCATPAILEDPSVDTKTIDCHDGTRCPVAFPVCVQPLANGEHCEAADTVPTAWGKRGRPRDAGAD